ncbi:hypothetical protein N9383_05125 [Granulosicoccus sp.]|nr:hypothetical protein [Granulosicoccus sp.]
MPGNTIVTDELQNAGHTLVFALLTFLVLRITGNPPTTSVTLKICTAIVLTGVLVELAQLVIGRGFSTLDIVKDAVGVIAGTCVHYGLSSARSHRRITLLGGFTLLLGSLATTAAYIISGTLLPSPPTLADFEQWGAVHRIHSADTVVDIAKHPLLWPKNTSVSARVEFLTGRWPSVQFSEVFPQWHHYECLSFRVLNLRDTPVTLRIRVDDSDLGPEDDDHMTVGRELVTGESTVVIALDEFREQAYKKDHPGKPLMKRISSFLFFIYQGDEPLMLLFDDLELGC